MKIDKLTIGIIVIGVLYVGIIIGCPIIYNYWYPNISDDSAWHIKIIQDIDNGDYGSYLYAGQIAVSMLYTIMNEFAGVEVKSFFLWFNFGMLALLGVLILVWMRRFGKEAMLIGVPLVVFSSSGVLFLFDNGTIFNVISIGILLPMLIGSLVWYAHDRSKEICTIVVLCGIVFAGFHVSGLYLKYFAIGWIGIVAVMWKWFKVDGIGYKEVIRILAVLGIIGIIVPKLTLGTNIVNTSLDAGISGDLFTFSGNSANVMPARMWIFGFIGISVAFLGVVACYVLIKNKVKLNGGQMMWIAMIGIIVTILLPASWFGITIDPARQGIDASIIAVIGIAMLGGIAIKSIGSKSLAWIMLVLVIAGGWWNIHGYVNYNSCITPADKEVIEWINENADVKNWYGSDEVSPVIYGLFTDKKYSNDSKYVVVRNVPMTAGTDNSSKWFYNMNGFDIGQLQGSRITKVFESEYKNIVVTVLKEN